MRLSYFSLAAGVLFLLLGILGLIPGLTSSLAGAPMLKISTGYGYLFGLFPVNLLHNQIHMGIGVAGIVAYFGKLDARIYARTIAVLLGLLALMGLIPATNMLFGLVPLLGHNIWLHAVAAAIAAYFGWFGRRKAKDPGMSAAA